MLPELIHEARVAGRALGERLRGAVAVGEGPVHAAPRIEPQAVLLDDRRAQALAGLTRAGHQPVRDGGPDEAGARRREVEPVPRERLTHGRLEPKQVDIHEAVATGDGLGGAREPDQTRVQSGVVAHPRVARFLEGRRPEHDDPRRHLRELQQQFLVSLGERLRRMRRVQRLHLPEPSDHGRRAGAAQVLLPGAPCHHAILSEHRVPLPAEVAELRRLRPQPGGQQALQRAGVLLDDHVLRAREHHDVLRVGAEPSVRKRGGAGAGRDLVGQPAERAVRRDFLGWVHTGRGRPRRRVRQFLEHDVLVADHREGVAMDLHGDLAAQRDRRIGLDVVDGLDAVEPDLDARAVGADAVGIPLAGRLERLCLRRGVGLGQETVASAFVIESAVVARPEVGLIPDHLMVRRHAAGT